MTPDQQTRVSIDALLQQACWHVCSMADVNIYGYRGVALREFRLNIGFGFADYIPYIDGKAVGVIEAKKEGSTLSGVEVQIARYAHGLPDWGRPLPPHAEQARIASEVDRRMSNLKRTQGLRRSKLATAFCGSC
jgi:type I restriction enzyme, R subunit